VVSEFLAATETLERRARGDWGPDQHLDQLAPSPNLSASRTQLPSAVAIFEAYKKDKQPSPATIEKWSRVFKTLDTENWRAPDWDPQQWLDHLVTMGDRHAEPGSSSSPTRKARDRSPRTVNDTWLKAARTVFGWAIRKRLRDAEGRRLVETNPFKDCSVTVPKQSITRPTGKAFTDDEIKTILCASTALGTPMELPAATRRWVPWMCAYTGARVGELTQLRVQDIEKRACGSVLLITPDAGTVKTGRARLVPLHPHLVEMGLLDYVAAVEARLGKLGPLFYRPQSRPSRNYRGPAVKARHDLAAWVRQLGITDRGIQPNHAWRHTFKTRAQRAKIEQRIRDEICGHAPRTTADDYEHPTVEDMAEALKRFPRYEVE
jgi:integrase